MIIKPTERESKKNQLTLLGSAFLDKYRGSVAVGAGPMDVRNKGIEFVVNVFPQEGNPKEGFDPEKYNLPTYYHGEPIVYIRMD